MNKLLKKIICGVLCAAVVIPISGCSNTKIAGGDIPTLVWYMPGSKYADIAQVNGAVNKITEEKIGAKVDIQFIDDSAYEQRMTMNMAAKSDYDICFTGYTNKYNEAVEKGGLLDITELLKKETNLMSEIPEYAWDALNIDGKIYAVPNQQTFTQTLGLLFRKDLADKYNFDAASVKTLNDLEPFLKKIKENEAGVIPIRNLKAQYMLGGKYEEINSLSSLVYMKLDGSHKIVPFCEIPEVREYADLAYDWFKKGYIRQDVATVTSDSSDIYQGKYACWGIAWKQGVVSEEQNKMPNIEVVGVNLQNPFMTRHYASATCFGISKNSKNPEKALKFIELLNTDKELYNLICWGIEGTHYTKPSENHIQLAENSGYNPNSSWTFGNTFHSYLLPGQADDLWEKTKEENDTAKKSELLELAFRTKDIRTEIANCSAVSAEYSYLAMGYQDPNTYFSDYVRRMKEAGVDKVAEEAQRQVDEFLKNKN